MDALSSQAKPILFFPEEEFNLDSLKAFLPTLLECSENNEGYQISFQNVSFWDPAALLWFSLCIKKLLEVEGKLIQLRLPDPEAIAKYSSVPISNINKVQKSADFLRRWQFDLVLRRLGDLENLLIPEQRNYFSSSGEKTYPSRTVYDTYGEAYEMVSTSLFPFFDFATLQQVDNGVECDSCNDDKSSEAKSSSYRLAINRSTVNGRIEDLTRDAVAGVLEKSCGIPDGSAKLFVKKIVGEALDNMEKHPKASFGMMALNRSIKENKIYLTVVDNGESICKTILSTYNQDNCHNYSYDEVLEQSDVAAEILNYSTFPEVSSKAESSGMGLYWMKKYSVKDFEGTLQILTSGVLCNYSNNDYTSPPQHESWRHNWEGNLLRVEIPMKA